MRTMYRFLFTSVSFPPPCCFLHQVCFRPTWIVSPYCSVSVLGVLVAPRQKSSVLAWVLPYDGVLLSLPTLPKAETEEDTKQKHTPVLTVCCQERPSWLSEVCTNALQMLCRLPSHLSSATGSDSLCPQEACLPLPWSFRDPVWEGVYSATSFRPLSLSFPHILSSSEPRERTC